MSNHKKLLAWQMARASALGIQRHSEAHWQPARAAVLDQVRRASLSVMLNISEGQAHGPGRRCRWHMQVAYGSAVETTDILEFLDELGEELTGEIELSRRVQALTMMLWKKT